MFNKRRRAFLYFIIIAHTQSLLASEVFAVAFVGCFLLLSTGFLAVGSFKVFLGAVVFGAAVFFAEVLLTAAYSTH
jgi:glucan phosphoethanolaminetransferase (alkaline phosphatase superfamily)